MRRIILLGLLFQIIISGLHAQTLNEWVRQKKTQLQYLTQQIAALQLYENYLHKGYNIAKHGLGSIGDIKGDEFGLHKSYFSSLSVVSSLLKNDIDMSDVVLLQSQILLKSAQCKKGMKNNPLITNDEKNYISSVLNNLFTGCLNNLSNLTLLTTDHTLQLSDEERFQRIKSIHADMQDKYAFVSDFGNKVSILARDRQASKQSTISLQKFYLPK